MITTLDEKVAVVFAGALSFGLYAFTLLICLRWLLFVDEGWRLRQARSINWFIVVATLLILCCNLTYLIGVFHWTKVAVWHAIHFPGEQYTKPQWTNILACTVANVNVLLADLVLIVRCWFVYGRKKIVIILFPSILWVGAVLCTILQIYLQAAHVTNPNIGPYSWASVDMTMGPGIVLMPFWLSTVVLNAYASGALILRIYKTAEGCRSSTFREYLNFFIHVLAESGVLYFSITIAHFLAWFGTSDFAIDIVSVLNAPITGIAFNWFLIRIARRKAAETAKASALSARLSTLKFGESPPDAEGVGMDLSDNPSPAVEADVIIISSNSDILSAGVNRFRSSMVSGLGTTMEV